MQMASIVADVTFNLPHSRQDETEADRIGVELAARAGYDPRAAITLWQKMGQAGGGAPPQFLSTHPSPANRQADLTNYSARVMPLYEAARHH
jgi:predicted Zn-dependent protease